MKSVIIIFLLVSTGNFFYAQTQTNYKLNESSDSLNSSITLLFGTQFDEGKERGPFFIVGASFLLYKSDNFSIPLEPLLHFVSGENPGKTSFFPRITVSLKYNIFSIYQTEIYIQGGMGIPILFSYLFDFSPALGISYKQVQIDIRNIFYFDTDGLSTLEINRWPVTAIVLGISI